MYFATSNPIQLLISDVLHTFEFESAKQLPNLQKKIQ